MPSSPTKPLTVSSGAVSLVADLMPRNRSLPAGRIMDPGVSSWLIYALWLILIVYLTVSAKGVKQEPQGHLLQSFSLLLAIVISFLLPLLPIFGFVNFAPVNPRPS